MITVAWLEPGVVANTERRSTKRMAKFSNQFDSRADLADKHILPISAWRSSSPQTLFSARELHSADEHNAPEVGGGADLRSLTTERI